MDTKELSIGEAATKALQEHANAKAIRALRRAKLEALQAEFDTIEPGSTDPANVTPESLERVVGQIRESYADLESLAAEHIGSPEHTLALDCLRALIVEYNFQSDILAVGKV
jgi:hypothetical protein